MTTLEILLICKVQQFYSFLPKLFVSRCHLQRTISIKHKIYAHSLPPSAHEADMIHSTITSNEFCMIFLKAKLLSTAKGKSQSC